MSVQTDLSESTNKEELLRKVRRLMAIDNFFDVTPSDYHENRFLAVYHFFKEIFSDREESFTEFEEWMGENEDLFEKKIYYDILKPHEKTLRLLRSDKATPNDVPLVNVEYCKELAAEALISPLKDGHKEPKTSQKPSILSKLAPYAIGVVAAVILALPRILGRGQAAHAHAE